MIGVFMHLCFLVALILCTAKPITSTSCQSECGGVSIPYPFGVGKGCFLDEWYEVNCKRSIPFLSKINKEIVKIDLPRPVNPYGLLRVKTNIASMGCSGGGDKEKSEELIDVRETPFIIGDNTLVGFGCNMKATLTHVKTNFVGCVSECDLEKYVENVTSVETCGGYRCCNANMQKQIGRIAGVRIERYDPNITTGGCGVAFLTDEYDPSSQWPTRTNAQRLYVRKYGVIQLKWKIITTKIWFQESLKCSEHSQEYDSRPCYCDNFDDGMFSQLACACIHGYKGNPYVSNGCKDIDECKEIEDGRPYNNCTSGQTCQNYKGSYRCVTKKSKTYLIYIGTTIGFLVILFVFWFIKKKLKQRKDAALRQNFFEQHGGGILIEKLARAGQANLDVKLLDEKGLKTATNNFEKSRILGEGAHGRVYKGVLPDKAIVAIKRAKVEDSSQRQVEEFINEVVVISQINHRNVVKLLGFCLESEVPMLVYEFITGGTLFDHLHGKMIDSSWLTWDHRLRIAVEVAGALAYLHSSASIPIIHRDVKSANILLDENLNAKVADFGASRLLPLNKEQLTTRVQGTFGYLDPEYYQTGLLNEKSDVYSYGVVLMELLSGQMALCFERPQQSRHLVSYFTCATKENRLHEVIDGQVMDEDNGSEIQKAARIAVECTRMMGEERPKMKQVAAELEALRVRSVVSEIEH